MDDQLAVDFLNRFDDYVSARGSDGPKLEDSREAVAQWYVSEIKAGNIQPPAVDHIRTGREMFDRYVLPIRDSRAHEMKSQLEYLLDALHDGTLLGPDDPKLWQAYKIGDGTDKALGFWTAEDWSYASTGRYRNAADVMQAARDFDVNVAQVFIDALRSRSVRTTAELFQ